MHLSDFIVTVQRGNGDSLPESTTRTLYDFPLSTTRSCITYLPFDSEYRLFFKNVSFKDAVVFVKIDGKDVLGSYGLRVPSNTTASLERFMVDGDLGKGKRFKFVSVNDERVGDPTDVSNGLVEVTVKFEKPYHATWSFTSSPSIWNYPGSGSSVPYNYKEWDQSPYYYGDPPPGHETKIMCNSVSFSAGYSSSRRVGSLSNFVAERASASQKGATVEGSDSNQSFSTTYMRDLESESLIFKFQLLAPKQRVSMPSIVLKNPAKYCSNCGVKLDKLTNFCPNCGQQLL